MKKYDMFLCGHVCLDIAPRFSERGFSLRQGGLTKVGAAEISAGGCVANSGMAAVKLGRSVCINAGVGADEFGLLLKNRLENAGADVRLSESADAHTAYSIVLSPPGADRIFLHYSAVNDVFGFENIDFKAAAESRLFHFGYPTLMKGIYSGEYELAEIMRAAKAAGCLTSLDMALPDENSEAMRADWKKILRAALEYIDFFVPSAQELMMILTPGLYQSVLDRAKDGNPSDYIGLDEVRVLAEQLLEMGAGVIALKCGKKGYYLRTAGQARLAPLADEGIERWHDREFVCRAIDTKNIVSASGAGDVSIAAFLSAAAAGLPPETAAACAVTAAHFCLQTQDAWSGIPRFEEILQSAAGNRFGRLDYDDAQSGVYDERGGVWLMKNDRRYPGV